MKWLDRLRQGKALLAQGKVIFARAPLIWVLTLPLLVGVGHVLPLPLLPRIWDFWRALWGVGAWPLAFFLAFIPFLPRLNLTWEEIDPRFWAGVEIAGWATLGLVSVLVDTSNKPVGTYPGGLVGYALARALAVLLGPSLVLPTLVLFFLGGLALIYVYSPVAFNRDVLWHWNLWLRAQLGPWLGWHLPSESPPPVVEGRRRGAVLHRLREWLDRSREEESTEGERRVLQEIEVERGYGLPPLSLLEQRDEFIVSAAEVQRRARMIRETLAGFGIPVRVVEVNQGPAVTQYCVQPLTIKKGGKKRRVSVRRILAVENDLALVLKAAPIRIEAPVPGKPYVGIEVPNPQISVVHLGGLLATGDYQRQRSPLTLALGRDVTGNPIISDLAKLPHLLIAGATGSGKSVAINSMIITWLMRNTPYEIRFVLIDPKRVELTGFGGIPHLIGPVITDVDDVLRALTWVMLQMDERYRHFSQAKVRDLTGYNTWARHHHRSTLPYIVVIIDELADIMLATKGEVEHMLTRLAQMARATGIHLVVATQRPSVDVITGLIKANFPARLAFQVTSQVDSRVILDMPGAESLLGRGDALFLPPDRPAPIRLQGAYVSDEEIGRVVSWWLEHWPESPPATAPWAGISLGKGKEEKEDLIEQAINALEGQERVSASFLQRKLRVGFKRAQELIEELEARGIVGPDEGGGKGRAVLR